MRTEKTVGARFAIHSAQFLLMHFKAFQFFVRTQISAVNPASPSAVPTSPSLKDSALVHSQAAGKGRWQTPAPTAVCSPAEPESSGEAERKRRKAVVCGTVCACY